MYTWNPFELSHSMKNGYKYLRATVVFPRSKQREASSFFFYSLKICIGVASFLPLVLDCWTELCCVILFFSIFAIEMSRNSLQLIRLFALFTAFYVCFIALRILVEWHFHEVRIYKHSYNTSKYICMCCPSKHAKYLRL